MTFAQLFKRLDQSNKTTDKVNALVQYFGQATEEDKIWALALFTHRRPKKVINTALLRAWTLEVSGLPAWLFEESYQSVGDLAETISLVWPDSDLETLDFSLSDLFRKFAALEKAEEEEKKAMLGNYLSCFSRYEKLVLVKLLTGGMRIGVSQNLVVQAIAKHYQLETTVVAQRITGSWSPAQVTFHQLLFAPNQADDLSKPYPFFLAHPIEEVEATGTPDNWQAEWKWDGIRSQTVKRGGSLFVWSRGEELITEKFPELVNLTQTLPNGTVIDGELLPWKDNMPLPFNLLQTRISRKNVTKKQLLEAPATILAYDLLEWEGQDIRHWPLVERRAKLEHLVSQIKQPNLLLSPVCHFESWEQLAEIRLQSREKGAEGLMLKRLQSSYQVGRKRGDWWKWKVEPMTIDAVLLYAQKGHGRRADLFTDYTFGVWHQDRLVTFAKAYSGLTDAEIKQVDAFIKKNTLEKFGPVRTVKPELVFELGFEGIQLSSRHKSGVAVRFPRILRWRTDKKAEEANTLGELKALIANQG